jgi:hypothetical protein
MASTFPSFESSGFFLWRQLKSPAYAAHIDNEEAPHYRIMDACQIIHNYRGIFEQMRRSMMRRVETRIESIG